MRKNKLLSLLFIPTTLATALPFVVSCGTECVTIVFQSSDGGSIDKAVAISVAKGTLWEDVAKPTVLANDGYVFDDWYNNNQILNRLTPIDNSMTITAKFIKLEETALTSKIMICNDGAYADSGKTLSLSKFNGLPSAYAKLDDFYASTDVQKIFYSFEESNYKTIITNQLHADRKATCTIDYKNQTITFSNMDYFYDYDYYANIPAVYRTLYMGHNYFKNEILDSYKAGKELVIDLNKYNIRCVWYNNKGYIPFEFLNNVMSYSLLIADNYCAVNALDFSNDTLYQIAPNTDDTVELKYKRVIKKASGDFYNSKYMEYIYNLLALTLDLRYGMVVRNSRAKANTTINYLDGGALKVLRPYHDGIVSLLDDVSSDSVRKVFTQLLDDGGHTAYMNSSVLSTRTVGSSYVGEELKYNFTIGDKLSTSRTKYSHDIPTGTGYYEKYENSTKGNIAYLTFDNFVAESGITDTEKAKCTELGIGERELADYTDENNYYNDTLRLTMYANKMVKQDNIKYLVLDLSKNGGGASYSEHFIASWLCGGVTQKIYNPKNGTYCQYTVQADINGDGKFDDDDKLSSDVQLYVITSTKSFSCGNILPCNIKDQRKNTIFIGHNSGGGPCLVDQNINLGLNSNYQISSTNHLLRLASDENNFITMDDGCGEPDWKFDEFNNPDDFYNRTAINNRIWS